MRSKKIFPYILGGILLIAIAVSLIFIGLFQRSHIYDSDLERLASESYEGIFLSMYSSDVFHEEDFTQFRGVNVVKCEYTPQDLHDIGAYLDKVFSSNNAITNIYLGLDPLALWEHSDKNMRHWNRDLNKYLLPYLEAHPDVSFEILYPAPSLAYWLDRTEDDRALWMTTCKSLTAAVYGYANTTTYFPAVAHWLIANPGNYLDEINFNTDIAQKLILLTFCDHEYIITPENANTLETMLSELVLPQREQRTTYPDLSDLTVVFFGDSVMGNFTGSFSVSGVVNGLSSAQVYNCAQGGAPATGDPAVSDGTMNFNVAVEKFIAQDPSSLAADTVYRASLEEYLADDHTGHRLCFVINYGLNDYFGGSPVADPADPSNTATYCGALRTGISALQKAYPDAMILLAAPNYITAFSNGTELRSEDGGVLTDYVQGAAEVAADCGIAYYDTYNELGIDEANASTYLADNVHPSEEGRYLFGAALTYAIDNAR